MANTPDKAEGPDFVTGIVVPKPKLDLALIPQDLTRYINFDSWAGSILQRSKYEEPNPDYLQSMLLLQTMTANSIDEVFAQGALRKLQEAIPNVPGAGTGPIEINGLYVTESDFGEGVPSYMILNTTHMEHGLEARYTTGSGALQAQVMTLLRLGVWPIKCQISRLDRKDRGGRYLFWLKTPDEG